MTAKDEGGRMKDESRATDSSSSCLAVSYPAPCAPGPSSVVRPSSFVLQPSQSRSSDHGAPTLLGGETAGDPAQVRIWKSSRRRIAASSAAVSLSLLPFFALFCWLRPDQLAFAASLWISFCVILFISEVLQPFTVALDGGGIAITGGHRSKALRWAEICAVEVEHPALRQPMLKLHTSASSLPPIRGRFGVAAELAMQASAQMRIPRFGLSRADGDALFTRITRDANLVPHPRRRHLFVSESYLALAKAQAGHLGQPPRPTALPAPESRIAAGLQWDLLTEQSRRVLADAYDRAAQEPAHDTVPEHLLTAIAAYDQCIAARILRSLGITLEHPAPTGRPPLYPSTNSLHGARLHPRLHGVVETALQQAHQSGRNFIGTEHLLVGLILEGYGPAFQTLTAAGVTPGAEMEAMDR